MGVDMAHPMGESKVGVLRLDFDRRLKLEFHANKVVLGVTEYRGETEHRMRIWPRISVK